MNRSSITRRRIATALMTAVFMLSVAQADSDSSSAPPQGSMLAVPASAPLFATSEDARLFWDLSVRAWSLPVPDARALAKAFLKEHLGIDGDAYAVAHFATPQMRSEGTADNTILLTDALMRAFPEHSRYTWFAALADAVSAVNAGGRQSPSSLAFVKSVFTCKTADECFSRIGRFLWSRTGPGYVYNAFIGTGNVREVIHEDLRSLDEAFGIFPIASTFLPENVSTLRLSHVIDTFKEENIFSELPYIRRLNLELQNYWETVRSVWPLLARYRFVHSARQALDDGVLTQRQYELAMKGGAPNVPLEGPITLQSLQSAPPGAPVRARRFDINGYAASDIVRFIDTDGSEVMYVPGATSPFVVFPDESALRQWVDRQARNPLALDELLSHFSIYNKQDGILWTGVAQAMANFVKGKWTADNTTVDQGDIAIVGDVFDDMRVQVEARQRDDTRMETSTAWDACRTSLNRAAAIIGPLGYVPPIAIPVQAGSALVTLSTALEQGIDGRTGEERRSALEQAVMTVVTNTAVVSAIGGRSAPAGRTGEAPAMSTSELVPLQRINGRIGYLMGPPSRPGLPQVAEQEGSGQQTAEGESLPRRVFDPLATNDARQPPSLSGTGQSVHDWGYLVMTMPPNAASRTRQVIDLKKAAIDDLRHRLEDFRAESLATNALGSTASFDQSIVYRVDDRSPSELLDNGGFGPSRNFNAISPMMPRPSSIGSGSLMASNTAFRTWQQTSRGKNYHQYAIWTDGRPVASASDNAHLKAYDTPLDEVHFPADIPAKDIFIIDSFDPAFARAIAKIYESRYVSTPYGVPLEALTSYLAGRLEIYAPNKFTQEHIDLDLPSRASSPVGTESTIEVSHRPLSSSDTSLSGENAPLIHP